MVAAPAFLLELAFLVERLVAEAMIVHERRVSLFDLFCFILLLLSSLLSLSSLSSLASFLFKYLW